LARALAALPDAQLPKLRLKLCGGVLVLLVGVLSLGQGGREGAAPGVGCGGQARAGARRRSAGAHCYVDACPTLPLDAAPASNAGARLAAGRGALPPPPGSWPCAPRPPAHLVVYPEALILIDGAAQHSDKVHVLAPAQRGQVPQAVAAAQVALQLARLGVRVARADGLVGMGVGGRAGVERAARTRSGRRGQGA
jgi:hypothetical protein